MRRGPVSPLVLSAMHAVARERFLPEELRESAREDSALPIGEGQTMSQPYIVALMIVEAILPHIAWTRWKKHCYLAMEALLTPSTRRSQADTMLG